MLTAGGFTGAPDENRTGTYTVSGNVVSIRWKIAQTWTEQWFVRPSSDGTLARLDLKHSTLATHGYGYGSNAALGTRRAMSSVKAFSGTLRQDLTSWAGGKIVNSSGQRFGHSAFRACASTTWCLTYLQPSSSGACQKSGGCPKYGGGTKANVSSIQYYLTKVSSSDRRDTLWHWCTCLAMERGQFCYTGNSHVKPLMQIIDDRGAFRGWVGAEASFSTGAGARTCWPSSASPTSADQPPWSRVPGSLGRLTSPWSTPWTAARLRRARGRRAAGWPARTARRAATRRVATR